MDILDRLRIRIHTSEDETALTDEAADEIERLRGQAHYHYENGLKKDVEIEQLREALRFYAEWGISE